MRILILVIAMTTCGFARAATTYTRFLLPVYADAIPGANGSRWLTTGWVVNHGTTEAQIIPRALCGVVLCTLSGPLHPKEGPLPIEPMITDARAVLMHVDMAHASDVQIAVRVRDLAKGDSAGTELPVVPESDFSSSAISLLNVPVKPGYRVALRVYGLPESGDPEVEIRYYRMPTSDPFRSTSVVLQTERRRLEVFGFIGGYRLEPSIAFLGNLQARPEIGYEENIWISITPVTPGLRIWAFATVTSNVTQQVTVISP